MSGWRAGLLSARGRKSCGARGGFVWDAAFAEILWGASIMIFVREGAEMAGWEKGGRDWGKNSWGKLWWAKGKSLCS